jgi:hypothetical protein
MKPLNSWEFGVSYRSLSLSISLPSPNLGGIIMKRSHKKQKDLGYWV